MVLRPLKEVRSPSGRVVAQVFRDTITKEYVVRRRKFVDEFGTDTGAEMHSEPGDAEHQLGDLRFLTRAEAYIEAWRLARD